MPEQTPPPAPQSLPDQPSMEWLRKEAKRRLAQLRQSDPGARLTDVQFALAKQFGFSSWRSLKSHVDALTIDGRLFEAARGGDATTLAALLDEHPDRLHARSKPYDATLLHAGASHLAVVDLLLRRGLDANVRERGDNTYAMHWAAAAGQLDVVRRLAAAGGDVIGAGDDHELEVIGWATCWDGCDDEAHRAIADFLLGRGARHHIFSAVAMDLATDVRRIVSADPSALNRRQSRNENHRTVLHFAVHMRRPAMVALLLDLGADPLAVDGDGQSVATYATAPGIDRAVMERIRAMLAAELLSARRGARAPNASPTDLLALLALGEFDAAADLLRAAPALVDPAGGTLHLMAKRNDLAAARWLIDHGANPNGLWTHWDAVVTPLHLAILGGGHEAMVRLLIERGADPCIRDSRHDSDAVGWAEFFRRTEIASLLKSHVAGTRGRTDGAQR